MQACRCGQRSHTHWITVASGTVETGRERGGCNARKKDRGLLGAFYGYRVVSRTVGLARAPSRPEWERAVELLEHDRLLLSLLHGHGYDQKGGGIRKKGGLVRSCSRAAAPRSLLP